MNYRNENHDGQNVKQSDAKDPKYFIEEESKNVVVLPAVSYDILLASECVQKAASLAKYVGVDLDLIKNTYSNLSEINISSSELNLKERIVVLNAELYAVDQILNFIFADTFNFHFTSSPVLPCNLCILFAG